MKNLIFKSALVLCIVVVNSVHSQLNSNDLSYGSDDKKLIPRKDDLIHNYANLTSIKSVLDLFSIDVIGSKWMQIHDKLSTVCSRHMIEYLNGLDKKEIWALKMDDASGHYSSGLFWGNNYWTGSMTLCRRIYREDSDEHFVMKAGSNDGHSGSHITHNLAHENPPFIPRFGVLKIILNDSVLTPTTPRTVFVGVCLPTSCGREDYLTIAEIAGREFDTKVVKVKDVRIPNADGFNLWTDYTFIIMITVSTIVGIFMICGTAYDSKLRKEQKIKKAGKKYSKDLNSDSSGLNCTTYDLTRALGSDNKTNCVNIGIPSGLNNNNSDENLATETVIVEERKLNLFEEILLSFSVTSNFKAICDQAVGNDTIPCIHGIRALSMAWIILGHTCIISFKYSDNMELRKVVEQQFLFQTITNGAFSVDTFFFISGFLVSFIYFRTNAKGKLATLTNGVNEFTSGFLHFGGLVLYRLVRLSAPYLYVLGIVEITMKYFASNSVFEPPTNDHINCPKYWWRNVFYINTLFPVDQMCMLWSWYLANDTQFYIIGSIILIVAIRHFRVAASTLGMLMVSAWITTGIIAYSNNHMPNTDDPLALFDKIYDKPWTRLGPYLVGMCVGWILFKTNCKIKFTKIQLVTGWTLSVSVLLYLLYGLYKTELTKVAAAAYSSLSHSAWAIALAWIVIACSTGHGGLLNKFFSATVLYPFSRVTYCAYLVHPIVIRIYALQSDAPLHMSVESMVIIFLGQTCASYLLSFIVSLAFEAPVCAFLRIFSRFSNNLTIKTSTVNN
ncbi:CLUMA_CG017562, isoform A [Clunio marinus]|uniref:CLUMA_CG017562, isoform A n=1 Tax=Clunio marinus TaxID=568069 RepID=A0A1J1J0V4_9DIPT|nr:CLUMA_CG017562, isoform A [Clunio marinus]